MGKLNVIYQDSYDPKALGARCDDCYLKRVRTGGPVPPEYHDKATSAVVTDFPRDKDVENNRPLTGPHGLELSRTLESIGHHRTRVDIHHAVACLPPEADLEKAMLRWQRENKKRVKAGEEALPSPIECCRPRLISELEHFDIVALGRTAYQSVTGKARSIMDIRGGPVAGGFDAAGNFLISTDESLYAQPVRVMPTLHPGYVQQARRWTKAFQADLSRAYRWFGGRLGWQDPHMVFNPTPDYLERFLSGDGPYIFDVETTFDDPLLAKLKCIGISTEEHAVCIHLLSIEGPGGSLMPGPYTDDQEVEIRGILRNFFADESKLKSGHNCLYAGTPVILGDGTSQPIEKLVRAKYAGEVMALDAFGRIVKARVTDWFRKRVPGQEWLVVRREGEKGGARGLTLTPDHEVYTQGGRVRADELVAGVDFILSGEPRITRDEYDAMLGSLLGDSTVATLSNNKQIPKEDAVTGVFRGSHTPGALAEEKARWLHGLLHLSESAQKGGFKPEQKATAYRTDSMRQVADMARLVYDKSGKRRLRREVLDRLGPIGFAWLFADDGFKHSRPDRENESVLIATCGFPERDIHEAADWFSLRFGPTTITKEGSLRLGVDATRAFIQYIAPYLLPAARYKLPKGEWPEFRGFPNPETRKPYMVRVESVKKFVPDASTAGKRLAAETRWCIQTTEGNFLTGFGFVKNCGYFDRIVIKKHLGVDPAPVIDTILMHRSVESELPHKLAYVGSVYTDVTSWKEAHTASEAGSDEELGRYCMVDCTVTARALPVLADAARSRGQEKVVAFDHEIQKLCVGLHEAGMLVDVERRNVEAKRLLKEIDERGKAARDAASDSNLNLNSVPQLRDLLFSRWGLTPAEYTKLGDPSTSDEALRLMRTQNRDNPQVREFIDALRRFRTSAKEYGTYVKRMVPYRSQFEPEPEWGIAFEGVETADGTQDKVDLSKRSRGLILPDGRIHPDYNAHGTTSGRLSSSNPNAQNFPKHLRGMVLSQPGHVIVGADADQLELRSIASVAGIDRYLEIFQQKGDPHSETAALMFGKAFTSLVPKSDEWIKLRNLAKSIKYASFYGAGDETVHGLVTSAEDKEGKLIYADLSLREVATLKRNWLKGIPELPRWWEATMEEYRDTGYILDPVLLRRRDFLDGENLNEIVNFPIQSGSAHVIHMATFDLLKVIPFGYWGPGTGLIAQVHDALYVEAPCHHPQFEVANGANGKPDEKLREFGWCPPGCQCEANWAARQIEKAMNRSHPGFPNVEFSATAKIGLRWSDV